MTHTSALFCRKDAVYLFLRLGVYGDELGVDFFGGWTCFISTRDRTGHVGTGILQSSGRMRDKHGPVFTAEDFPPPESSFRPSWKAPGLTTPLREGAGRCSHRTRQSVYSTKQAASKIRIEAEPNPMTPAPRNDPWAGDETRIRSSG
jgi:hypothetical protein